jgi:micrococcal nuclease
VGRILGTLAIALALAACTSTNPRDLADPPRTSAPEPAATSSRTSSVPPRSTTSARSTTTTASATSTTTSGSSTTAASRPTIPPGEDATVERVVDGDTLATSVDRVRLIGIDTPESVDPRSPVECFGKEASAFMASLVPPGTRVRLVTDVEPYDRYDRLLAYVYRLDDGLFVNAEMLRRGYASVLTIPPNVAHADQFFVLQRRAREANRGLWAACDDVEPPPPTGGDCDTSYPDVCIPSPPPDLDCDDVAARRFRVVPPDPHRFDGNGDGIGCVS